jgi:hypothetical protein
MSLDDYNAEVRVKFVVQATKIQHLRGFSRTRPQDVGN